MWGYTVSMKNKLAIALSTLAITYAFSSHPVLAQVLMQTQGSLTLSDRQLTDGSFFDEHTFTGQIGQQISIQLTSDEFDTYLALKSPSGNIISEVDDVQESTNSSATVVLPEDGVYTIIANGYDAASIGAYNLVVSSIGENATSPPVSGEAQSPIHSSTSDTVSNNSSATSPRDGFDKYEESGLFSIEYPEDWYVEQSSGGGVIFYNQPPPTRGGGSFPANFVKTEVHIQSTSFEEAVRSLRSSETSRRSGEVMTRQGELTVGGRNAFRAWFSGSVHNTDYIVTLVRYSDTKVARMVSYTTSGETWAVPTIQDIHWSFRAIQ